MRSGSRWRPDPRIVALLAALSLPSAAFAQGPLLETGFEDASSGAGYTIETADGTAGPYARFGGDSALVMELSAPVEEALTVDVMARAEGWPGEDKGFSATTPPTLVTLLREQGKAVAFLRVRLGLPELSMLIDGDKRFASITGPDPLPTGEWVRVTASYDGTDAKLFVDGEEVATKRLAVDEPLGAVSAELGAAGKRRLVGDLDEVSVYGAALTPGDIGVAEPE